MEGGGVWGGVEEDSSLPGCHIQIKKNLRQKIKAGMRPGGFPFHPSAIDRKWTDVHHASVYRTDSRTARDPETSQHGEHPAASEGGSAHSPVTSSGIFPDI